VEALEDGWRAGERVGEALVRRGLVSEDTVARELELQLEARLAAVFRFREGEVLFVEGARSGEEPVRVAPRAIIARALLSAVRSDELAELLVGVERTGALGATERRSEVLEGLELSPELAGVISKVGERTSFEELAGAASGPSAVERPLIHRAVFLGMCSGALRWVP
jgi:hypothetical protein